MGVAYAEVIGDPVAQSRSPAIHAYWLARAGLQGEYRPVRVADGELAAYLDARRDDPDWRGCSVTMPHKRTILPLLDRIDAHAEAIGAVNCVYRGPDGLVGRNTDVGGVACALAATSLAGRKATIIGGGGAARAAIEYLCDQGTRLIALLVREPAKAGSLRDNCRRARVELWPLERCDGAMAGAAAIVNASPMGMDGGPEMPAGLLACIAAHASGATAFDMVYRPLDTPFLTTARASGAVGVDGLTMLIGQARPQFETFFGTAPPEEESGLRSLLAE